MTNTNDVFKDENKPESNWFKFDKIGVKVAGTLVETRRQEGQGNFPAQLVYVLRQENGEEVNVGISENKSYVTSRANKASIGDTLGFKFEKEVPSQTKGNAPAKSIEVFIVKNDSADIDLSTDAF